MAIIKTLIIKIQLKNGKVSLKRRMVIYP